MQTYDKNVSDEEFDEAGQPSGEELAITAQALGMAITAGVPLLVCFLAVIEITPNARLRRVLSHAALRVREEEDIASGLSDYSEIVGEKLIAAVRYGENVGDLNTVLFQYASDMSINPHAVAKQIGRSDVIQEFTARMARNLEMGFSGYNALRGAIVNTDDVFRRAMSGVVDSIECGSTLSEALDRLCPQMFDRLYLNVVKAGEVHTNLECAFDLLARC